MKQKDLINFMKKSHRCAAATLEDNYKDIEEIIKCLQENEKPATETNTQKGNMERTI